MSQLICIAAFSALVVLPGVAFAQPMVTTATETARKPATETRYYRLEFVVKELDEGKVTNSRVYSLIVPNGLGGKFSMRTGSRVPVATQGSALSNVPQPLATQFNYMDVGVNIDCFHVREQGGDLGFEVAADISNLAGGAEGNSALPPVVRNTRWTSDVLVPLRKPVILFSSDDVATRRKMQLEVTAAALQP